MTARFDAARIGAAWDRAQAAIEHSDAPYHEHPDGWAIDWASDNFDRDPEQDWQVIEWIAQNSRHKWSCVMLAAGPLEDLIANHGEAFIARIEQLARRSPRWRFILSGVWPQGKHDTEVWRRIEAARRGGPDMDAGDPLPDS